MDNSSDIEIEYFNAGIEIISEHLEKNRKLIMKIDFMIAERSFVI